MTDGPDMGLGQRFTRSIASPDIRVPRPAGQVENQTESPSDQDRG
ncbi:MAG TPA: hypothetical protein VLI91_07990 [Roseiarcus sp.]|nr:hypothetical protein [Roseiarcus sp.]